MVRNNIPVQLPDIRVTRNDTVKTLFLNLFWTNSALILNVTTKIPFAQYFGLIELHIRDPRDGAILASFSNAQGSIRVLDGQILLALGRNYIDLQPGKYRGDIEFHRLTGEESYTLYRVNLEVGQDYTYDPSEAIAPVPGDYAFADIVDCSDRPMLINYTGLIDAVNPLVTITPADGATGVDQQPNITFAFNEDVYRPNGEPVIASNLGAFIRVRSRGEDVPYRILFINKRSINIQPLEPFGYFQIVQVSISGLVDAAGNPIVGASSNFVIAARPTLPPPSGLGVGVIGKNLELRWDSVTGADSYFVEAINISDASRPRASFSTISTNTTFVGEFDTTYQIRVATIDEGGNQGSYSAPLTVSTGSDTSGVGAPTNVQAFVSASKLLTVTFTPAVGAASHRLYIYRNSNGSDVLFTASGFQPGSSYNLQGTSGTVYVAVASVNATGAVIRVSIPIEVSLDNLGVGSPGNPNQNPFQNN